MFGAKNELRKVDQSSFYVEHESIEKIATGNMFCNTRVHNKHR